MKKTLFIIISLACFACQSPQKEKNIAKVNPPAKSQGAMQSIAPKRVSQKMVSDSIRPPANSRFVMDKSRQKTQINSQFPYDIDLKTADGKIVNSSEVLKGNGKPTILLFWLTTCFPCSLEMAAIQKKYKDWQKEADFQLFALSTDFQKNYPKFVKRVEEKQWPWPAYNDVNREFRKIMPGTLNGLPQTFVLDKNGQIAYHKRKYKPGDEDALFAKVKELAAK